MGGLKKSKIIAFTPLDVYLALGLLIVGENVNVNVKFEKDLKCHTRRLFKDKEVIGSFTNIVIIVHGGFFKLLDDLSSIGKYN
ncbi:hypothetical protein CR513_32849, partial [Mucuna pruriens]